MLFSGTFVEAEVDVDVTLWKERKLSWRVTLASVVVFLMLCAGCSSSSNSNTVPQAQPSTGPTTGLPTPTPANYTGPDLTNAVPLALPNNQNLTGLNALMPSPVATPLVGDPLVDMVSNNGVQTIRLAAEDSNGLQARDWPLFPGTDQSSSTSLNMIFADDQVVILATGTIANGQITGGNIFYRVRQASDPAPFSQYPNITACENFTLTCTDSQGNPVPLKDCGETQPDLVTPCEAYMSTSNASVIKLGTFEQMNAGVWPN